MDRAPSTTLTTARALAPSTEDGAPGAAPAARVNPLSKGRTYLGDTVLVLLGVGVTRPMIVSGLEIVEVSRVTPGLGEIPRRELRVSGTIFCGPEDHLTMAVRQLGVGREPGDPARIHGRPDRHQPFVYGEHLREGTGLGEWQPMPLTRPVTAGRPTTP